MKEKVRLNSLEEKKECSTIVSRIKTVNLKRLLLPSKYSFVKNNGLIGSYEYDVPKETHENVSLMDIDVLVAELKKLRSDINLLSKSGIILERVDESNIVVQNNQIYLFDISKLGLNNDDEYIINFNNIKLNELFGEDILIKENHDISKSEIIDRVYTRFLTSTNSYIEDYYKENVKDKNLRLYLKREK